MPAVENKENNINSWRKNIDSKVDKEKSLQNSIQNATIKLFPNFSTEEKSNLIISIPSYLKLPGTNFQGVFNMLIKLKNDNLNNPKLAQSIINHIKKLNKKNTLDIKNRQSNVKHKTHQLKLDIYIILCKIFAFIFLPTTTMNFKNTINSTKETLKKQAKNLALSTALIASLTACGPSDKKSETTTPTDSTKTEVVAKDTVQKTESKVEKKNEGQKGINSMEDLDDETLAMFDEWDSIHKEEQKKLEEQSSKQTPREQQGISKEVYEDALSAIKRREETLQSFYNDKKVRESKEGLNLVNDAIENYHSTRKLINQPISPKAQKVIDLYNNKKKELNK